MKVLIGGVSNYEYSEPEYYLLGVFTDEEKIQKAIQNFNNENKTSRTFTLTMRVTENIAHKLRL